MNKVESSFTAFLIKMPGELVSTFFTIFTWCFVYLGRIKVVNYDYALRHIKAGKVMMISNHPSLIETIILPCLFWPYKWIGWSKVAPWSVADIQLFSPFSKYIYPGMRCVAVDRTDDKSANIKAIKQISKILQERGTILVYPEGGRTCKGEKLITQNGRILRECSVNSLKVAVAANATIMPVWIEREEFPVKPESFMSGVVNIWKKPMVIKFGTEISGLNSKTVSLDDVHEMLFRV